MSYQRPSTPALRRSAVGKCQCASAPVQRAPSTGGGRGPPAWFRSAAAVLALMGGLLAPATASAQGAGGPGCTNLPEYNRALGALQGMTSACDMSVEEACRILAARGTSAAGCRPTPSEQRGSGRRRH